MDWVNIPGYYYKYQINKLAQVRRIDAFGFPVLLKPCSSGQTRVKVCMRRDDGSWSAVPIVNLMADAFMGGKKDGYNIIHKDGDKNNNELSNLAFATKKETAGISGKRVAKMLYDGTVVATYPSATKAAKANYISLTVMCGLCTGEFEKSCHVDGFYYRYVERGRSYV